MRISILLAAATATAALTGAAMAGETSTSKPADFTTLDADKNGSLSKDEFKAALPEGTAADRVEATFASMDANKDGAISKEEAAGTKAAGGQTANSAATAPSSGDAAATSED